MIALRGGAGVDRRVRLQVAHLGRRREHEPELGRRLLDALAVGQPGHVLAQARVLALELRRRWSAICVISRFIRSRSTLKNTIPASSTPTRPIQMRPLRSASSMRAPSGSATAAAARPGERARRGAARRRLTRRAPDGALGGRGLATAGGAARAAAGAGATARSSRARQRLRRRGPSALHRRDPAGGPQAARLRARVLRDLAGRGRHRRAR